jgi:tetratricopeptide (TPR) repeat protein
MNAKELYREGLKFLNEGNIEKAHDLLSKANELSPDHPDILSDLGVVYFHQRRMELAMIFFNRAQELDPDNGYRYSSRAYIKDKLGDVEGAIEDYKKAIEIDPEDAISYNNLGLAEERLGYMERARDRFAKADELRNKENNEDSNADEFVMIPPGRKEVSAEEIKSPGKWKIIGNVFTRRGSLREFFRFILNGFRLKE